MFVLGLADLDRVAQYGPGFVPDKPTGLAPSRVGLGIQSIVAPDTANNYTRL